MAQMHTTRFFLAGNTKAQRDRELDRWASLWRPGKAKSYAVTKITPTDYHRVPTSDPDTHYAVAEVTYYTDLRGAVRLMPTAPKGTPVTVRYRHGKRVPLEWVDVPALVAA